MKIILVMVTTADGKTTLWQEPLAHGWSSPEDQVHFRTLIDSHEVIVMGSNTYAAIKSHIRLSRKTKRIIITTRPMDYACDIVKDQLEFTGETPEALVQRLEGEGYTSFLLVGGSRINSAFLEKKLISECILTIEPRFTGNGNSLFAPVNVDVPLTLMEITQLNKQGTLLARYRLDYARTTR